MNLNVISSRYNQFWIIPLCIVIAWALSYAGSDVLESIPVAQRKSEGEEGERKMCLVLFSTVSIEDRKKITWAFNLPRQWQSRRVVQTTLSNHHSKLCFLIPWSPSTAPHASLNIEAAWTWSHVICRDPQNFPRDLSSGYPGFHLPGNRSFTMG